MPYYFDSTGAECELCEAMEGWYDEEPAPPHPNCNCRIGEPFEEDDVVAFAWTYTSETVHERPNFFIYRVTVTVECVSGRKMIDTKDVEFDERELLDQFPDIGDYLNHLDDEAYVAAAQLADEMGQDCPPTHGKDVDEDFDFA